MYEKLIENYIKKLSISDVKHYALKEGISLTDEEVIILLKILNDDWLDFYNRKKDILEILKKKVDDTLYQKIEIVIIKLKKDFNF